MPNSVISEGNTTNEAIENGLKILKVSKNMVNIKILDNDKKSFFSILAPRVVKVELTIKEDADQIKEDKNTIQKDREPVSPEGLENAQNQVIKFLDEFLNQIGTELDYIINKDEFGLNITINGEETGFLIGYRGETLYALQSVISNIANKNSNEKIRIILDIGDYKEKREKTLQNLALKIAKSVERNKKPVTLEPMQAYERKIIHSILQNSSKVKTESVGEEPRRRVVISLK